MSDLRHKTCEPCKGGVPPLKPEEYQPLLAQLNGWKVDERGHLTRTFTLSDFKQALALVNRIGELAEREGHHPDLHLSWGRVGVEIWTHKINGLSESDFILAAKIDELTR